MKLACLRQTTSQSSGAVIESLRILEISLRSRKTVLWESTQKENGMRVWIPRFTRKKLKQKLSDLRKRKKMIQEMKNDRNAQSIPINKRRTQTSSRIKIPSFECNRDGEVNSSNTNDTVNKMQDVPFRTSELDELRKPVQPETLNVHTSPSYFHYFLLSQHSTRGTAFQYCWNCVNVLHILSSYQQLLLWFSKAFTESSMRNYVRLVRVCFSLADWKVH